jgi:hypothetical protein
VHDHRPDADELLSSRLASGWEPTPTDTRDGPVIMGFACKRPPAPAPKP